MHKKLISIIAIILVITGISIIFLPTISNTIGTNIANSEIEKFNKSVSEVKEEGSYKNALDNNEIDDEGYPIKENGERTSNSPLLFKADLDRLYNDSIAYNENLKENQKTLLIDDYAYKNPSINLYDYGIYTDVYGYLFAPTIGMNLPIYLGANASAMSYGAAHLTNTSLPIGGKNTNCVIAGHTGYIGRIFFDNLRGLSIGDNIILTNYWGNLNYRVSETKVVKENQTEDIYIKEGKDILTLITCISNQSGGFDRYCVICERL